jgi:tetratricopeptide (TPR) repeat protein
MRISQLILLLVTFIFSGCGSLMSPTFTPEEKRALYSSVQEDISHRSARGELHYAQGYYAAAVEDFEAVNFYEGRAVIPLNRIKRIAEKADERSAYYYERGMKVRESDKKQSLIEFNRMMRCNPKYKDGKVQYDKLKNDKDIMVLLSAREADLNTKLQKNIQSASALKSLNQSLEELAQYDDSNLLVIKASEILDGYRKTNLEKGIALYEDQKYDEALNKFELILQIYPKEPTAQKYLDQLASKQEEQKRIKIDHLVSTQEGQKQVKLARTALKQKDYCLARKYASKVLEMDTSNKEGQYILEMSTKNCAQNIPALISKGVSLYKKQQMENALEVFQSVLAVDVNNTTSIAYIKKIKQQLQTIKSLK